MPSGAQADNDSACLDLPTIYRTKMDNWYDQHSCPAESPLCFARGFLEKKCICIFQGLSLPSGSNIIVPDHKSQHLSSVSLSSYVHPA